MPQTRTLVLPETEPADIDLSATGSALFIGNATVLIRFGGFTLLTDPNFLHAGDRAYLGKGLWSKRITDPALEIEDLPALDLILLSHLHDDHFDAPTRKRLVRSAPVITTEHAAKHLRGEGFVAHPLDTWDTQVVTKGNATMRVTAMPGVHSTLAPVRALLPPVMGSMVEFETLPGVVSLRMYITGDTLFYEDLREIPRRYPEIDLAMVHLGGTRVMGVTVTMDGEQGTKLLEVVRPREAMPIHYDDYTAFKSPLSDFRSVVAASGVMAKTKVVYVDRGQAHVLLPRRGRAAS